MPTEPLIQKMIHLADEWETQEDQRTIFLRCYSMMTNNMMTAVSQGRFQDNEWVNHLLHHFADYYFNALACFECGEEVPLVWQVVHSKSKSSLHVLQHLLLGINAHINYDLVLSIYDMLYKEWDELSNLEKASRYQDHQLVNKIIGETIDKVQDEVIEKYDPRMDWVDRFLGRLDEIMLSALITRWRTEVWEKVQALLICPEEKTRQAIVKDLERAVLDRAKWIAMDL